MIVLLQYVQCTIDRATVDDQVFGIRVVLGNNAFNGSLNVLGLVERWGKYQRLVEPGIQFIIPFMEHLRKVDMREQVMDVPPQEVITKDNVVVTVDAVIYYEITDPVKVTYNVAQFKLASIKLAQTNLRNILGEMALDETLTSRDVINTNLKDVLDQATDSWGVRVTRVEIQKIDPPADITEAMHRQMKAERLKRATILEAEGARQAEMFNVSSALHLFFGG